jgi:hypothetical protein
MELDSWWLNNHKSDLFVPVTWLIHCHPVAPTSQCGPRPRVFSFMNLINSYLVGRFGQGLRLYYLYRRNADMRPCRDWDSKPRLHCRNGRRLYRTLRRTVSQLQHCHNCNTVTTTTLSQLQHCHNYNTVTTTTLSQLQHCHNSKSLIFQDQLLNVLKCCNFL